MGETGTVVEVPCNRIPNQSSLFLSYLELSPKALPFYQHPPTFEALVELARTTPTNSAFRRNELTSILRRQNDRFGADADCRRHINDLEQPDCFAVVTGQQVGLFGGPLYTVYKAFTAIRIAEELRSRGIRAVPVFWLDTDDHDLAEVTHCTVVGADSSLHVMDYRQLLFGDVPGSIRSVGMVEFPPKIRQVIEDYFSLLPNTEWKAPVRSRLESAYHPGSSFADAFGRLLAQLCAGRGLVLFDPRDSGAKRLASPIFRSALEKAAEIHGRLSARNRELAAAEFHSQVTILENSTLLFLHEQGERKALVREGSDFALKGTDLRFSLSQLLQVASDAPERLSPNVLLRPIVQDSLLPTLCYIGGPGEIAYFAQAETLYRLFNRQMPVIWPRVGLTLLDAETAEVMSRYGLTLQDCFLGKEHVLEIMLQASRDVSAGSILTGMQHDLTSAFDELRPAMVVAEASLGPALDTARRKISHHLEGLRGKFIHHEARQNAELLRRAELFVNACYPNKNLQERELGIYYFLSRHGPRVLDVIYSFMKIDSFAHRVAVLSP